jgi:type I restriction enzyme S subunit
VVNITFAWEGAIAIANDCDHGALVSHRFPTYTFNPSKANSDFVRQIITTKDFVYKLFLISPGGAGRNRVMNKKDFLDIKIFLPELEEQQKIAECLSSLDELISAHTQKLDTLKAHKKGLMQQLFPEEGETVPKLRFSEFRDAHEWEEKFLGKEATIVMGASPKSEFYNEDRNGLPLLQGNTDIKNRISAPRIFTSQITKECQKGDILLSVRAPVGTVAKSIHHACIGRGMAAIRVKNDNSQEFLYQWLLSFEPRWQNISQGGTFDAVNSDAIRNLITSLPSETEQQKIADCLSSLDELITAQTQKLDRLKTHKKGLMQQLFPSADEMTG